MGALNDLSEMADVLADDDRVRDVAVTVGPKLMGKAASHVSGVPLTGGVVEHYAGKWADSDSHGFTKTTMAVGVVAVVGSLVSVPMVLGLGLTYFLKKLSD